jgi:hypothetical protein
LTIPVGLENFPGIAGGSRRFAKSLDFFLGQTGDFKVESFSVSFIEDVYSVSALPKLPTRFTSHDCFEFPMIGKSDGRHGLSGFRYLARMAGRLNRADEFLVA